MKIKLANQKIEIKVTREEAQSLKDGATLNLQIAIPLHDVSVNCQVMDIDDKMHWQHEGNIIKVVINTTDFLNLFDNIPTKDTIKMDLPMSNKGKLSFAIDVKPTKK